MITNHKEYLGDSVYADVDEAGQITLEVSNGEVITSVIYLDHSTASRVIEYIERMRRLQVAE